MGTFVCVHGSWHGGWCWEHLVPLLAQAGHLVLTPDLAGLGADVTPPGDVTLAMWTEAIGALVADTPEPVVLVGHSRGGIVISQVAEEHPDQISCLVYLAAFLLRDGESLLQVAQTDTESQILPNLLINEAEGFHTIQTETAPAIFYNASPQSVIAGAVARLRPEPNAPTFTPLQLTDANFGRVPRVYIRTLRDRAVGPVLQERMVGHLPCRDVLSLDTDHSPFFSAPRELAKHLLTVMHAQRIAPDNAVGVAFV
jgi:pimeloyl-ACP methyl ester carboxylesterase